MANYTSTFTGAQVDANLTLASTAQQPPLEGPFVNGDKTKLNGIEAGADVTDTANVTSSGAVMDGDFTANGLMQRTALGAYTVKAAPAGVIVGTTDLQTMSGKTFGDTPTETVFALSGTAVALEPDNGSVQTHTLTGNTTYTDALANGQAITVWINDGAAFTATWPTMTWVNNAGAAPTLATTGFTVIALVKIAGVLYGALVGNGS